VFKHDHGITALAHYQRREIRQALQHFDHAVECGAPPHIHSAMRWSCCMLLGEYERAWTESDISGASFDPRTSFTGKSVAVQCLRGLGDAIQFLRYLPQLRKLCSWIKVQPPVGLEPLLPFIPAAHCEATGKADIEIECSDLPYLFRSTVANIPAPLTICLDPSHLESCRARIAQHAKCLNVGVAWAAGGWNPVRSFPLEHLLPLAQIPGVALFSLQRGPEAIQLEQFPCAPIVNLEFPSGTIADSAAFISCLDLIVTPDTMVAHLAGSLGKPVWTLLPYESDWRWMLDREDSPWYPSMRLFRQDSPGDWHSVFKAVSRVFPESHSGVFPRYGSRFVRI
jgi:hypothetical protein